jgi:O-antigen ligase
MHVLNPRSNRERIVDRLRTSEHGGPAVILLSLLVLGAYLTGLLGGAWVLGPIFLGVLLAGLPTVGTGLRVAGLGFTLLVVLAGGGGAWTRVVIENAQRGPMVERELPAVTEGDAESWTEATRVARSFPILGTGLGSYPVVEPYFKKRDTSATSAGSSLLQWWAEAGLAGLAILGLGVLAIGARLPRALGRVNRVDRPLAFGLLGALAGFMAYSAVQWSVELLAVALAASALLGVCERWLCGGTDLFVEPV